MHLRIHPPPNNRT